MFISVSPAANLPDLSISDSDRTVSSASLTSNVKYIVSV